MPITLVVPMMEVVVTVDSVDGAPAAEELLPPLLSPLVSRTVTTECAGNDTVTAPPESVAPVDATECELSVSQASATACAKPPLKETLAD
jgi:hypothetical protein